MHTSAITSVNEKSKLPDASKEECTKRIMTMAEHWYETANDEFGFGVIHGLRIALDILEGKK